MRWSAVGLILLIFLVEEALAIQCRADPNNESYWVSCDVCVITRYLIIYDVDHKFHGARDFFGCDDVDELTSYSPDYWEIDGEMEKIKCTKGMNEVFMFELKSSNNKTLEAYRKCCSNEFCNEELYHIDSRKWPAMREWEDNHRTENIRDKDNVDLHFVVVDIIQFILSVSLLLAVGFGPQFYLKHLLKYRDKLQEDRNALFEFDLSHQEPPVFASRETSYTMVSGAMSLKQLAETFAKFEKKQYMISAERASGEIPRSDPAVRPKFVFSLKSYIAVGRGHKFTKVDRQFYPRYDNCIWRILENGPFKYNWKPLELIELFDQAKDVFITEPALLKLSTKTSPVVIIGDIRGQYQDLHRWLQLAGYPPEKKLLFLGSVVENDQEGSLECLALVALLKCMFPKSVFLLRGVGETLPFDRPLRFDYHNDQLICAAATRMFSWLPLAATINSRILCVHSGISHQILDLACFNDVQRPFAEDSIPPLAIQIIFNLPTHKVRMYRHGAKNRGEDFGVGAVERTCHDLKLDLIIRSRSSIPEGIAYIMNGKMWCIWSAPGHDDTNVSAGSIIEVQKDNENVIVHSMQRQKGS